MFTRPTVSYTLIVKSTLSCISTQGLTYFIDYIFHCFGLFPGAVVHTLMVKIISNLSVKRFISLSLSVIFYQYTKNNFLSIQDYFLQVYSKTLAKISRRLIFFSIALSEFYQKKKQDSTAYIFYLNTVFVQKL